MQLYETGIPKYTCKCHMGGSYQTAAEIQLSLIIKSTLTNLISIGGVIGTVLTLSVEDCGFK
jgi:hypothetical protein